MTNAKARFNNSLRPRKPEGSLGRTAQDGHLDSHTAPELWQFTVYMDVTVMFLSLQCADFFCFCFNCLRKKQANDCRPGENGRKKKKIFFLSFHHVVITNGKHHRCGSSLHGHVTYPWSHKQKSQNSWGKTGTLSDTASFLNPFPFKFPYLENEPLTKYHPLPM